MANYTLSDLEDWLQKIEALAKQLGLDPYSQDFEVCDHEQMLGFMVYSGMPSHYPHWSYGKNFEKLKTLYDYGVSGLPYEMVINSNPSIAYLMRDNSLLMQVLTMAHVFGHSDFFKNNFTFRSTRPEFVVETFKTHADRVRRYIEDSSIGRDKVEKILDAAHAISLQCRRDLAIKKRTAKEFDASLLAEARKGADEYETSGIHKRKEIDRAAIEAALRKVPREPDEDILLFLASNNHFMEDWERDLLTIVHEEAMYFIPQIQTKIMNEGWASFWHKRILEALGLPHGMMVEFLVSHNQVLAPSAGGLNPYHLGINLWEDICRKYDDSKKGKILEEDKLEYDRNGEPGDLKKGKTGLEKIFEVRAYCRDASFLAQFLGENLIRKLGLFEHTQRSGEKVILKIADPDSWKDIKKTLIQNVGTGTIPVIKVEDANYNNSRTLLLKHYHDGRDLHLEYAEKTIAYIYQLWKNPVILETVINDKKSLFCWQDDKLVIKPLH